MKGSDLPQIDLLIVVLLVKGFQSLIKTKKGLEHAESKLFWEYIRLLEEVKPKYLLKIHTVTKKLQR